MGKRRKRSPSPESDTSSSSSAEEDTEVDPRLAGIVNLAAAQRAARDFDELDEAPLASLTNTAPKAPTQRATTPDPKDDDENDGENYQVRRLLRNPRYFDDDFELAALRCFRCGGGGHREAECVRAPKVKPCHLCGEANHLSRDCPHGLCFNCLRTGHRSRDCAEQRGFGRDTQSLRCLRCGGSGHGLTHCLENFAPKDLGRITCYVCGEQGHLCCAAQDCAVSCSKKDPKKNSCCRCGGVGHDDSECAQGRRGGGYQGGHVANQNCQNSQNVFACFKCGGNGHIARECPAGSSLPSGNEPVDLRHTLQGGGGNKSGGGVPQGGAGGPMRGNPGGSKYGGYAGGTGGFRNQNTTGAGGWAFGGGGGGRGGWGGGGRGRGMGNDACMGRGRGGWSNGGKTGGKPRSGPY